MKAGPAAVPARPQAVPGAARGRAGRAAVAAGAPHHGAGEPRPRQAAGRAERAVAGRPGPRAGRVRCGEGRGVLGAGEGARGRAQPRLHHDPLAGDRARQPLAAAPGRVHQRDGGQRASSPTSPRSIRSGSTSASRRTRSAKLRELIAEGPGRRCRRTETTTSSWCCSDGTVYPHTGKINFADPSFSQDTGSFLVRAVLPNPKRELRPGMFVTANVKGAHAPERGRGAAARRAAGLQRPPGLRRQRRTASRRCGRWSSATTTARRTS